MASVPRAHNLNPSTRSVLAKLIAGRSGVSGAGTFASRVDADVTDFDADGGYAAEGGPVSA
jgi:hypothetical protein